MPYQWHWVVEAVGLTEVECQQAAWAVTPDGQTYRGAAGINRVLDTIGTGGIAYWLYKKAPIGKLQDRAYQWVAENRKLFPGTTPAIRQEMPWLPERA